MLGAARSLFVVTSGIAAAIVLFAGCEPVLPEDTSPDTAGSDESYVGSYIAVGRSVEATLDVSRDQFTMVTLNLGSNTSQVIDGRRAAARGGSGWYIVDGTVSEREDTVQFKVTGIEINRSSSDSGCAPILATKDASLHTAAIGSLLDCLGIDQQITAERLDPPALVVGTWEIPYSAGRPRTVEYRWTIHRDGTSVLRNTYSAHETIDFLEFTMGVTFTATTLTLQPITSIRAVLVNGTEVDGGEYLDYYNEQIDAYRNVTIHYTVTDEFMTWDFEVFGVTSLVEPIRGIRFVRIN